MAALRATSAFLFMHLGTTDRDGEEGIWRFRNEEGNGDDETKRLVMSWRGCLVYLFLLNLILVLSLSWGRLTETVAISEGEMFSSLSFPGIKFRAVIDVKLDGERKKKEKREGVRRWSWVYEEGTDGVKCVNYSVNRSENDGSQICFRILWRDYFCFENGYKTSDAMCKL